MSRWIGISDREGEALLSFVEKNPGVRWRLRGHAGVLSWNRESIKIRDANRVPRRQYAAVFARDLDALEVAVAGGRYRPWSEVASGYRSAS